VAASARYIQTYLHLQSDARTCTTSQCPDYAAVQRLLAEHVQITAPISALLWGIIATLAIVFSAALLIYRLRVAENTLRLLGLVGFTVLLTFWIFSLALSGFNALFSLMNISQRVPFPQPGASTIISLAALVIVGTYSVVRTMRNRRANPPPQPVGALRKRDADSSR
jgi:ABC-type dipeptide/oligopeptide/nickel transport system permease component